jgi:hypothetical protein
MKLEITKEEICQIAIAFVMLATMEPEVHQQLNWEIIARLLAKIDSCQS